MIIRRYFILSLSALMLAGCAGDEVVNNSSSTDERLPLRLEATLSGDRPVTRAVGSEFETGDVLYSYVRHVYSTTDLASATSYELASQASLVEFEKGSDAMVVVNTSTNSTSDLTPGKALYWDDFSNASVSTDNLRQDNHGLQSYYGYCYNGGTPTVALNTTTTPTGVLVWTTTADQSAKDAMKHNDLLWSPAQTPVVYDHGSSKESDHGTITVPYTHAMSMFTIVVEAKDGYKDGDLKNTIVTLKGVSEVGTFDAPKGEVTASGSIDVTMCPDGNTNETTRTYQAVTVPHTKLEKDKVLATITDAGGNNYEIIITEKMLEAANWGNGLTSGETKSGVNYLLNVKLNKQAISVSATLADWIPVTATGEGEIQFSADIKDKGNNDTNLKKNDSFSLWRAKKVGDTAPAESDFGTKATIYSYDGESFSVSSTSDPIYWPNKDDSYFFRALAYQTSEHTLLEVTSTVAKQGTDLLWATTPAHETYEAGAAIAPRTGTVPLSFEHAMSKVIITLATKADNEDPAYVNLNKATIKLTNLSTSGIIALIDGEINAADAVASAFDDGKSGDIKMMIPQKLDNAKLVINLHDGATDATSTTYSLSLKDCIDDKTKVKIGEWLRGNQYSYTITITKEEVKFRAMIQKWTENYGSGEAKLDWD